MKFNKILIVLLTLLQFSSLYADNTTIADFLDQLKTSVQERAKDFAGEDSNENAAVKIGFIEKTKALYENTLLQFKNGLISYNPEVRFKFMKVAEEFEDLGFEDFKPRDLRHVQARIIKFDKFLSKYCQSLDRYLSAQDKAFFTQLRNFCQMLLICIDDEADFDIDAIDKVCDYVVYRPIEWMKKHPFITVGTVAVVVAGVVYFTCFYDSKKGFLGRLAGPSFTTAHKYDAGEYEVEQPSQLCQRGGTECGYHALWRIRCRIKDENAQINNEAAFKEFYGRCRKIEGKSECSDSYINENSVSAILRAERLPEDSVVVLNQAQMARSEHANGFFGSVFDRVQTGKQHVYFMVNLGSRAESVVFGANEAVSNNLLDVDNVVKKAIYDPDGLCNLFATEQEKALLPTWAVRLNRATNTKSLDELNKEALENIQLLPVGQQVQASEALKRVIDAKNKSFSVSRGPVAHWVCYDFDLSKPKPVVWAGNSLNTDITNPENVKVLGDIWENIVKPALPKPSPASTSTQPVPLPSTPTLPTS